MATPRKRKVKTVADENYSELDMYCIWLHEYYGSLVRAGFKSDLALGLVIDKASYPSWVKYKLPTEKDIERYMDEEDE